ncbi:MAG: Fructokinase [Bacteroidota bacterium]|jgi:predicted NBD/HSP70 family sugar kinase
MSQILFGIDLGGTKIEGVTLEIPTDAPPPVFRVLSRQRLPTEQENGYQHIVSQIVKLVGELERAVGKKATHIGIGTPGTLDPTSQLLKNSNTVCLNGKPLKADLEKQLGIEVRMANDANCFVVAEALLGAVPAQSPSAKVVFGIIMGTGVGGGVFVNGQVLNGRHGIGGEWGHNFLDTSGGACYCGRVGCVEKVLAGVSLENFYFQQTGKKKKLKIIADEAPIDPAAQATMQRLHHFFGKAVANVINILDPDAIVIGGGVGNIDSIYTDGVDEVRKFIFNNRLETQFLKPALGDSAGVFGAAML